MRIPALHLFIVLGAIAFLIGMVGVYSATDDGKMHYTWVSPSPTPSPSTTLTMLGYCDKMGCVGYGTHVGVP